MPNSSSTSSSGFFRRIIFFLKMLEIRLRFVFILLITALLVGYWDHVQNYVERWQRAHAPHEGHDHATEAAASPGLQLFEYFCPMHQFVVRTDPGKCPICGMNLSQRLKGAATKLPEGVLARVQVSPDRIAQAGVQVEEVETRALTQVVRSYGVIEPDETRTSKITARFPGRIEQQWVNTTGQVVKKGDSLARIYSPKFLAATQEYLQAVAMNKQSAKDAQANPDEKRRSEEIMRFARQRLSLAGFTSDQLDEMERTGKADERLILKSPLSGTVLERNSLPGEVAEEGTALYTIADLSVLWVQVLILESDIASVHKDMPVEITSVAYPGHLLHGTVDFIAPTVIPDARAIKVRVVVQNSAGELRPGMFINATMRAPLGRFELIQNSDAKTTGTQTAVKMIYTCPMDPEIISDKPGDCPKCGMALVQKVAPAKNAIWAEGWACSMHPDELSDTSGTCTICDCGMQKQRYRLEKQISVPESAVIDTGQKQVVYVETSPGVYDARAITLGTRTGSWYPVRDGLKPGERIVTRGSFLIDAEARLNPGQ
ncbi:TPA: hypothetical protein DDW35_12220 [Candidatus Sumerlaeota bacterium]|jgi:membrane fusion protein, copper/silver efflux system|nr:hypothetical protein [Candidatus Sumerlaeota bacterium]